jgi:hypothetical protein
MIPAPRLESRLQAASGSGGMPRQRHKRIAHGKPAGAAVGKARQKNHAHPGRGEREQTTLRRHSTQKRFISIKTLDRHETRTQNRTRSVSEGAIDPPDNRNSRSRKPQQANVPQSRSGPPLGSLGAGIRQFTSALQFRTQIPDYLQVLLPPPFWMTHVQSIPQPILSVSVASLRALGEV